MQILKARFHSREEFDEAYNAELPNGGLFVPTTTSLRTGEVRRRMRSQVLSARLSGQVAACQSRV